MSESPFQIAGVASGIGWDEIITKSIEAARKPATQWQNKIDSLEYKRTLYQEISSSIFKLRNTFTSLKMPSAYKKKTAEWVVRAPAGTDASNIIKATPNGNAEIAAWDIKVTQRAKAQQHISNKFDPSTALKISGRVQIQVGMQVAFLDVEESDTIRTINQKINSLTGPDGKPLAATAKLIDNHLVIESELTGLDTEGPLGEIKVSMFESLYKDIPDTGDPTKTVRTYQSYLPQPAAGSTFPPQLYMVKDGNETIYYEGKDYTYDNTTGVITWKGQMTGEVYMPKRPADGATITAVVRGTLANRTSGDANSLYTSPPLASIPASFAGFDKVDLLPTLPGGALYADLPGGANDQSGDPSYMANAYMIADATTGVRYQYGTDYEFRYEEGSDGQFHQLIVWRDPPQTTATPPAKYTLIAGTGSNYTVNHRQLRLIEEDPTSENSVLARLGITTISTDPSDPTQKTWAYTPGQFTEAQDAKITLNGVEVTRPSNTIPEDDGDEDTSDELIANVKLELLGEGDVTMNITQDAEKIIEEVQAFVDAYNEVLEIINFRLEEKYNSNTTTDEEDTSALDSILKANRGSTTFGPLHGDQLLWSIKNQMRGYVSNPIASLSSSLNSRKYLYTNADLGAQGSFYLNAGGMSARINVSATDSLEDIKTKIQHATAINSTDKDGATATKKELGLKVDIVNGQLVVAVPANTAFSGDEPHSIDRNASAKHDDLPFVPSMSQPVNGNIVVYSGSTLYTENVDYTLETFEDANGVMQSHINWLDTGKSPIKGKPYNVVYEYDKNAVGFTPITGTGDLAALDLHYDKSNVQLSSLGIETESLNYGKSGLLEFDQDKFFEALSEDTDMVSNVMLGFMNQMDTYVGNLVDSSNVLVGGAVVTKGRIAAALNNIDSEVASLSEQITKLEKQLQDRQAAMYKQYSSMEQAIQQLNAQMSSMSQFFSQSAAK